MNKILVYGAGGLGRGIIGLLESINKEAPDTWRIMGFVDDQQSGFINDYKVWGNTEQLLNTNESFSIVLAIGNPELKKEVYSRFKENSNLFFPNIIHPSVECSRFNTLGIGNVISKGVSMSINIQLGDFNLVHYNCSVGHDVMIGNYNSIFPLTAISGYVSIGDVVEIGTNSAIIPSMHIGNNSTIGAGSTVINDVKMDEKVAGVPARKI